ncbi:YlmH family RNA-binding protein [Metabacillus malikii]|uniref:RNA-binding protein YlmH n=1 Tax=Metabacillus malikii TaxID=1504265 RepID=A0ABT9ZG51_9BACI|nr:RNA-binding protein [Metabacillus malikii]MDQ0231253.1 RNA-binding protein YlmH [Metabacillus malikii]
MNNIYQHFREDERHFIDQVVGWKQSVEEQYSPRLSDFLDPREQEIVQSVIGEHSEVKVVFSGGKEDTERKRAFVYPDYYQVQEEDFNLQLFEIHYPSKFIQIQHRQVLGSLMGLGLKRSKFGDIRFNDTIVQFICALEISDYLKANFHEVGRTKITLKTKNITDLITDKEDTQELITTVSSMRLDVVCSTIYNLSRQKIQPFISNGLVKVNWKEVNQHSFECREGDTISIRGYGRSKIMSIEGKTKKDKWRIVVSKHI